MQSMRAISRLFTVVIPVVLAVVFVTVGSASAVTPTIGSLSPTSATAGGAAFTLTINGANFASGATTKFGTTSVPTTFKSATQLTAAVPASAIATAGTVNVVVTSGGVASAPVGFTINPKPPTITSISPTSAAAGASGFTLTVNGANYVSGATVNWNGSALPTTFSSATKLTATVAASLIKAAGTASVTVTTTGGTSAPATFTIYPPPTITSLSPSSAVAGGAGFTLTINGANFVSGSTTATWVSTPLTVKFVSAMQLTASITAAQIATAGTANVTVTTPGGTTSASVFTINPKPPTITSISPTSAAAGASGFTVTVNGANYVSGATVNWNGSALPTTFSSATKLTATVAASLIKAAGTASVTVTTPGGTSAPATFTIYPPPTISSLSPSSAVAGGAGFTLTINGANFVSGLTTANWGSTALTVKFVSAMQLTASITAAQIAKAGTVNVTVTTPGGTTAPTVFSILGPAATPTFTPPAGTYTSVQSVTISSTTQGAIIRYTTNGNAPNSDSPIYQGPITVGVTETLKAFATAPGSSPSAVGSAAYTITLPAATPTFTPPAGTYASAQTVAISSTTPNATIYYTTNGNPPSTSSTKYTAPITVGATETINAIATATSFSTSAVGTAAYIVKLPAATPTFSPAGGTFTSIQTVTISDATPNATIYFTTNGNNPSLDSPVYNAPIKVGMTETVKAIAISQSTSLSAVGSAAYIVNLPQAATPAFSVPAGTYTTAQTVTITDATSGATIFYTTNGSTPTIASSVYGGPITVNSSETLSAMATAPGFSPSPVASAAYTINSQPLYISPFTLPTGTLNTPYNASVNAQGTVTQTTSTYNYLWTVNGNPVPTDGQTPYTLSNGIQFTNSGGWTLNIGGTPNQTGTVQFNLQVTACTPSVSGCAPTSITSGPVQFSITVNGAGAQLSGQIYFEGCGNIPSLPFMTVTLSGGGLTNPMVTQTDSNGNFTFQNVQNGSYTITPSLSATVGGPPVANAVFYPASQTGITVNNGNSPHVTFQVVLGYTINGTVTYSGSQTGRIYVQLNNSNCGGGLTPGTSLTAPGTFTIRGVPPGTYTLSAWMDTLGTGAANANNPAGSISNINIPNAVRTTVARPNTTPGGPAAITLSTPLAISDPGAVSLSSMAPGIQGVSPFSGGVLIPYQAIQDNNGVELPTSYTVAWSTSSVFASTLGKKDFKATGANGTSVWVIPGLTNGQVLYFWAEGHAGNSTSNWSKIVGPITIGAPTTGNTVTGAVTFPGTATGPLYVGFYNQNTNLAYVTTIAHPVSSQAYSLQVPTGNGYFNFAILDQNNDGLVDAGDLSNTNGHSQSGVNVTGPLSNQNITLSGAAGTSTVTTQYFQQINPNNQSGNGGVYNLQFDIAAGVKQPVSVTLSAASNPNVILPMDIGQCTNCGDPYSFSRGIGSTVPNVGDTYTFTINWGDGTSSNLTAAVTGVLSTPPSKLEPSGADSSNLKPTFTWSDTGIPSADTYQFQLMDSNYNTLWQIPGKDSGGNGFSSSITSIPWGTDPTGNGTMPSVGQLTLGAEYYWQVQAQDSNGNQAVAQTYYFPGFTQLSLPSGNPATLPGAAVGASYNGTIQATGGYPCYSYQVNGDLGSYGLNWGITSNNGCSAPLGIFGTPNQTGTVSFSVTVYDNGGDQATQNYTIVIGNALPVSLPAPNPSSLPSALIGFGYAGAINATGGVGPYKWSVNGTSIPTTSTLTTIANGNGLQASNSSGNTLNIGGTPTSGPITLNVSVTDGNDTAASTAYTITTASGPDGSHNSSVKGQYACLSEGFNDSDGSRWASLSTFTIDGKGAITSGIYDENGSNQSTAQTGTLTGTYSIGADNNGLLTVTAGLHNTMQWAFAVTPSSSPASQFRMIEIDTQGMNGAANCLLTTPTAFASSTISGSSFAFQMGGENSNGSSSNGVASAPTPKTAVGRFSASTGNLSSGVINMAKGGCTTAEEDSFTGTYTAPDSNGRFAMTLSPVQITPATCPSNTSSSATARPMASSGNGGGNPVLTIYIVDASRSFILETDAGSLFAGNVRKQQQASYSGANINSKFVLYMQGGEVNNNVGVPKSSVFQGIGDGAGNLTINSSYQDKNQTYSAQQSNGGPIPVTFDSTYPGRVTFQPGQSGAAFLYLFDNNSAFEMDMDGNGGFEGGWVEAQKQTTFTNATLAGHYLFGQMTHSDANQNDNVGELTVDSSGNVTGMTSTSGEGGFAFDQALSLTYSWDTTVPGTGSFLVTDGSNKGASCIVITATKFACTQQTDTPGIMLMQQ